MSPLSRERETHGNVAQARERFKTILTRIQRDKRNLENRACRPSHETKHGFAVCPEIVDHIRQELLHEALRE